MAAAGPCLQGRETHSADPRLVLLAMDGADEATRTSRATICWAQAGFYDSLSINEFDIDFFWLFSISILFASKI